MNEHDDNAEPNLAHLLRASYGPAARVGPALRESFRHEVVSAMRARSPRSEFPIGVLMGLTCLVLVIGGWSVAQAARGGTFTGLVALGFFVVVVNLACVPVASGVILVRRKHA